MGITLEQAFASIIRYVQGTVGTGSKLYLDELPENFQVPSVYFPVPTTESRQATFDTWLTEIYVDVWFMGGNDWDANSMAVTVRDGLLRNRCLIDIVSNDGTATGRKFRLTEPRIRKLSEQCVSLSTRIRNYVSFQDNDIDRVMEFSFKGAFESYLLPETRYLISHEELIDWPYLRPRAEIPSNMDVDFLLTIGMQAVWLDGVDYPEWGLRYVLETEVEEDVSMTLYLPSTEAGLDGAVLLDGQVRLNDGRDEL